MLKFACGVVASFLLISCSANRGKNGSNSEFSSGPMNVRSGVEGMANDNQSAELISGFEGRPGWPDFPRRWKMYSTQYSRDGGIQMGLKLNAFGSEVESTTTVKFGRMRQNKVWILMHSPSLDAQMTREEGNVVYLDARTEHKMVAICMYSVYLTTSADQLAKITVAGSGVRGEAGFRQETEITQTSDFMHVKLGDSITSWQEKCENLFQEKIRDSVDRDLINASKNMRYHTQLDQCIVPTIKSDRLLSYGKHGDRSCEQQDREILGALRQSTIQRCIPQEGLPENVGICRIRGGEGSACRLYKGSDGKVSDVATTGSALVSSGMFEYACDKLSGMTCQITKEGGWFRTWSEPYRSWEGRCVKSR